MGKRWGEASRNEGEQRIWGVWVIFYIVQYRYMPHPLCPSPAEPLHTEPGTSRPAEVQRGMKPLLTATALSLTSFALAAPLLGTTDSFVTSKFCKTYACELAGKDVLGPGLSEWRYTIKGEFPVSMGTAPEVVSVLRQNNRVISAHLLSGAQDTVLYPGGYKTKLVAALVDTMTGKAPTDGNLLDLNNACESPLKQVKTIPWNVAGKQYRLSCLMTAEYANAWRFSFHVHLP